MCRFSLIIPAFNEEAFLPRTLRWALRAMRTLQSTFEVIVVDDGSTDATKQCALAMGSTVVTSGAQNIAAARNAGAAACCGEVLIFLDADTLLPRQTAAGLAAAVSSGIQCGGCGNVRFYGARRSLSLATRYAWYWCLKKAGLASGCFMFSERSLFEGIGGFDEALLVGEDIALGLRLKQSTDFFLLHQPVYASGRKTVLYTVAEEAVDIYRIVLAGSEGLRDRNLLHRWYTRPSDGHPISESSGTPASAGVRRHA